MPKMKMRPPEEDKEKIKQFRQDIKDMKLDMKETFSVMDDMPKPKRKRRIPLRLVIAAAVLLAIAAAAAFYYFLPLTSYL